MKTRFFAALAACFLLCASMPAFALDIPATISGDHYGGSASGPTWTAGYACRVIAETSPGGGNSLEFKCIKPTSEQTTGKSVVNGCPNDSTLVPLTEWGTGNGAEKASPFIWVHPDTGEIVRSYGYGVTQAKAVQQWIRISAYQGPGGPYWGALDVRIGSFQDLLSGGSGGQSVHLYRGAYYHSTRPYAGCGGTGAPKPFAAYCVSYIGCDW